MGRAAEAAELEKQIRAARIERWLTAQLEDAPPLTDEQIGRIAAVLGGRR